MSARPGPLRLLWVSTKPPWPPRDGGRLLQLETLELLAAVPDEIRVDLVAPLCGGDAAATAGALQPFCRPHLVPVGPLPLPLAVPLALLRRLPVTAVRHRRSAVARAIAAVTAETGVDVVHAEQVQAMPQALAAGRPVLLRAQNVESDLWRGEAGARLGWLRRRQGDLLAGWEGEMVRRADAALALTDRDAARLSALAGRAVEELPVPFPAELPAGPPLPGDPAVVLLAGAGWRPNREGAERFVAVAWPRVVAARPGARLHLFGDGGSASGSGVVRHPAPADAATAFAAGALLVVPLALASGVRMKVLEGWARGLPVVASAAAAAGLAATSGRELLVGDDEAGLADALLAVAGDATAAAALVAAGRDLLRRRHRPAQVREALLERYRRLAVGADAAPRALRRSAAAPSGAPAG